MCINQLINSSWKLEYLQRKGALIVTLNSIDLIYSFTMPHLDQERADLTQLKTIPVCLQNIHMAKTFYNLLKCDWYFKLMVTNRFLMQNGLCHPISCLN